MMRTWVKACGSLLPACKVSKKWRLCGVSLVRRITGFHLEAEAGPVSRCNSLARLCPTASGQEAASTTHDSGQLPLKWLVSTSNLSIKPAADNRNTHLRGGGGIKGKWVKCL